MSCINVLYRIRDANTPNGDPTNVRGELHANYWKLPNGSDYNRAVDFGVYLENLENSLESISITVPFSVKKDDITDLSSKLFNEDFLSYLFSSSYQVLTLQDCPTYRYAKDRKGEKSFCIYELCSNSIEVKPLVKGTQIIIKILSDPKNLNEIQETIEGAANPRQTYNLYFRFRISKLKEGDLCFTEDISNDFLQSAFSRSEMSHVKINELREINHSDIQDLTSKNSFVTLFKFHFFFIGSSEDEAVSGSTPYVSCALLEPSIWKDYIGNLNPLNKKCISYHWKSIDTDKHSVFFKTVYSCRNKKKLFTYASAVIVLSLVASICMELLKCSYNTMCSSDKKELSDSIRQKNASDNKTINDNDNSNVHKKIIEQVNVGSNIR